MFTPLPLLGLLALTTAQQAGDYSPEVHPQLPSQTCTRAGGCKTVSSSIVIDAQYRWLHNVGGYDACRPADFDPELCPDPVSCAENCAVEGADYASLGVTTSGDALTMNLFVNGSAPSPRVYLLGEGEESYEWFQLLNREFTFDVDMSKVPCGINGALYFSEMDRYGDRKNGSSSAGAAYGAGYCDAQCPKVPFIYGEANLNNTYGSCCNEMDIWESNSAATSYTPHPCTEPGVYRCSGASCGNEDRYGGVCDKDGCDLNPYRNGAQDFYGIGNKVDTSAKFTVVTQFITNTNTSTGDLVEIRRYYIQDGVVVDNSKTSIPGLDKEYDSLTDEYCAETKEVFGSVDDTKAKGGLQAQGASLGRGVVLAMAIWQDGGSQMLWLDGTYPVGADPEIPGNARGPCGPETGKPAENAENYPDAAVTFSNIKSGELFSTFDRKLLR